METPNTSALSESRPRYWLRVLRPLLWWLLFVLMLYGIRIHQRLMEQTRLDFTITLAGNNPNFEVEALLDGNPAIRGQKISLGMHQFKVTYPKMEEYSTNLFVWYGKHNLGEIVLNRSHGTLAIHANPSADKITIRGPEFQVTLTNSPGITSSVPTDLYVVEANYRHWRQTLQVSVAQNLLGSRSFEPRLGLVQMTCNQENASFQILQADGHLLESGDFPSTIREVPEGSYKVVASHHRSQVEQTLTVNSGITNHMNIEFLYGGAVLESDPKGAVVTSSDGRELGRTPLRLPELQAGHLRFNLTLDDYERAFLEAEVVAGQTNSFSTNLVNSNYAQAINAARRYLADERYNQALEALGPALDIKPGDVVASALLHEITGRISLRRAIELGERGNYSAAITQLESALADMPDNSEVKKLLTDFKQRASK